MPWPVHPTGFFGAQGDNDTYKIERSLRFNSADSAYLDRTLGTPTSQSIFTFSCWVKRSTLSSSQPIFSNSSGTEVLYFKSTGALEFYKATTSYTTTAVFRDVSAWGHLVFSSNSGTIKLYWNGVEILSSSVTPASLNSNGVTHYIGRDNVSYFSGYITEINFIDGQALTPSSFGETDAITGRWKAKAYSGTYGTNGFYLKFADNSGTTATTLGKDSSGNGNNWTPNNFSVTAGVGNDSLLDSPTNNGTSGNYCTFNAIASNLTQGTLYNGNLEIQGQGSVMNTVARGNMAILGKAYAEFYFDVVGAYACIGVVPLRDTAANDGILWSTSTNLSYRSNGNKRIMGTETSYGATWVANNVIGVAVDSSANTVEFFKNGVSQGVITSSAFFAQGDCTFAVATDDGGSPRGYANFGQRPFAYTAPTGFKTLCTTNLPTPTIRKPSSAMDVVTYTGNGSARSITGLGFSPDLVWIKGRSGATDHAIYDSVRGVQKDLGSNLTTDETTQTQGLTAFNSDGFDIGTLAKINTNTSTYVAWAWDRAAIDGLDIVSYTGNGANRTISHNLGVAPKMIIVKARTTAGADQGWPVYHSSLANTQYLLLNSTAAAATGADYWNSTSPTSSVFSLGTNAAVNLNNDTYIAYLFAEVEGFSKFGSYTGNGSSDGPFVWCGFRPKYWIIKRTDSSGGWWTWDTARNLFNPANSIFRANNANAEDTDTLNYNIDFLSNGFKVRATSFTADGGMNVSGGTYIFAAFAESAFKYSRAR